MRSFYGNSSDSSADIFRPFTNDIIFSLVMRDPEICVGLLQLIIPQEHITFVEIKTPENPFLTENCSSEDFDPDRFIVEIQKSLKLGVSNHGIRLDAYASSPEVSAEIEMQTYVDKNIPKRARFYQANMTLDQLEAGKDYGKLKRSYVIMICTYDPFALDEPVYSFVSFDPKLSLTFGDEAYNIILNTACSEDKIPPHLKDLFDYINNPDRIGSSALISKIDERVRKFNTPDWRRKQMTFEHLLQRNYDDGYEKGLEIGEARGAEIERKRSKEIIEKNNLLTRLLLEAGRSDDLLRASQDEAFKEKLYKELGIE